MHAAAFRALTAWAQRQPADDVVPQASGLGLGGQRADARGRLDLERLAALVAAGLASIHALPLQSV